MMETSTTERGAPCIIVDHYVYQKQKNLAGGRVCWECERRRVHGCKAKIHVIDNVVVKNVNEHNHTANSARAEIVKIRAVMKMKAETTEEGTHNILSTELQNISKDAAAQLPTMGNLRRAIRRNR